jgi:CheY-like chemotaxis protein
MIRTNSTNGARPGASRSPFHAWIPNLPKAVKAILIVEDETPVRRLLVEVLSSIGYRIESVADGSLALRILESDPDIELVLTDLCMPGIQGTEVAEWIVNKRPEVKIVCMSGNPKPHEVVLHGLLEKRLVNFLPKPFAPSQVIQMVKRLLDGK